MKQTLCLYFMRIGVKKNISRIFEFQLKLRRAKTISTPYSERIGMKSIKLRKTSLLSSNKKKIFHFQIRMLST